MQRNGPSSLSRIISLGAEMLAAASRPFQNADVDMSQLMAHQGIYKGTKNSRRGRYGAKQPKGFRDHNPAGSKPAGRMLARHG